MVQSRQRRAEERHLTPEDLVERFGVPISTIYRWNYMGTGPRYMTVGKHVRYRLTDVESWENESIRKKA